MLSQFVEQLNVVYSVTDRPQITMPLTEESAYLVALELRRAQQGLTHEAKRSTMAAEMMSLADFYHCVYEELLEMIDEDQ